MKVTVIGSHLCPDTLYALNRLAGAGAEVEFKDFAAPLINDSTAAAEATQVAEAIYGADRIIHDQQKALGADDFADYLAKAKGIYGFIGTGNPADPNTLSAHHHGLFDLDEESLLGGCNLYVDYALAYLKGKVG